MLPLRRKYYQYSIYKRFTAAKEEVILTDSQLGEKIKETVELASTLDSKVELHSQADMLKTSAKLSTNERASST